MTKEKYSWVKIDSEQWAQWEMLVANSKQGTIFSRRDFLESAGVKYELHFVLKGKEIKAGVCVIRSSDATKCELDDLVIHSGLLFKYDDTKKAVRRNFIGKA